MKNTRWRKIILTALPLGLIFVGPALPQAPRPAGRPAPRLEPVAETKLLMEGLTQPNFRALEKLLKDKPPEDEAWTFARGQALLIAETANLLMLRPPRNNGQDLWMERSMGLRDSASNLARSLGKKDYETSRTNLFKMADACNRCHKSFQISVKMVPYAAPGEGKEG